MSQRKKPGEIIPEEQNILKYFILLILIFLLRVLLFIDYMKVLYQKIINNTFEPQRPKPIQTSDPPKAYIEKL